MSARSRRIAWAAALSIALGSSAAGADVSAQDRAAARSLFYEARKLVEERRYAEACPKFEESQRLDPGIGTLFNLADCYETLGKSASAWSMFLEVAAQAKASGHEDKAKAGRQRAESLAPRLSRLTIALAPGADVPGIEVRRDGTAVGRPFWGSAVPLDGGTHTVEAAAPGKKRWSTSVQVAALGANVVVTVPALEPEAAGVPLAVPAGATGAPAPAPAPVAAAAAAPQAPASPEAPAAPDGSGQRTIGLVVGGAGVVGLGVGTLFLLQARSRMDEAAAYCDGDLCREQAGLDLRSEAVSKQTVSFVVGGIGLAALATGAVLYVTAPRSSPPKAAVSGRVAFALGPGALLVNGAW